MRLKQIGRVNSEIEEKICTEWGKLISEIYLEKEFQEDYLS